MTNNKRTRLAVATAVPNPPPDDPLDAARVRAEEERFATGSGGSGQGT